MRHCRRLEQLINTGEPFKGIIKMLETKMVKQVRVDYILRLLCLFSVTNSGIKKDDFDFVKKIFLMNYGYQEALTLANL